MTEVLIKFIKANKIKCPKFEVDFRCKNKNITSLRGTAIECG